jgi:AcrR family transcriptional regulator
VKRDAIRKGAKAVFLKRGFQNASMAAMALRAGASEGALRRHFASKEAPCVFGDLCGADRRRRP